MSTCRRGRCPCCGDPEAEPLPLGHARGVPNATAAQIKKAYKTLSLEIHPDRNHARGAEEAFKLVALALLALSLAYAAVDASGGAGGTAAMISWEDAAASFNDAMGLVTDATRAGSDMLVSVNSGDAFLGEEAAWLMRESAEWAASVGEAVRSVEDFVLC